MDDRQHKPFVALPQTCTRQPSSAYLARWHPDVTLLLKCRSNLFKTDPVQSIFAVECAENVQQHCGSVEELELAWKKPLASTLFNAIMASKYTYIWSHTTWYKPCRSHWWIYKHIHPTTMINASSFVNLAAFLFSTAAIAYLTSLQDLSFLQGASSTGHFFDIQLSHPTEISKQTVMGSYCMSVTK